jgi:hypothetical protein
LWSLDANKADRIARSASTTPTSEEKAVNTTLEQSVMVDMLDLKPLATSPAFSIGDRVWAESHVGVVREFCITGLRICALPQDTFDLDGDTVFVRGGVFDAREPLEWEYQISDVGGRTHGREHGWLKAAQLQATKPTNCWHSIRETQPVPPMVHETE